MECEIVQKGTPLKGIPISYFKFFLLSCPQAASISDPNSLLTVATIPWSFR